MRNILSPEFERELDEAEARAIVRRMVTLHPTPQSVAFHKQAAAEERKRIFDATGILIHDDGRIANVSEPTP